MNEENKIDKKKLSPKVKIQNLVTMTNQITNNNIRLLKVQYKINKHNLSYPYHFLIVSSFPLYYFSSHLKKSIHKIHKLFLYNLI